MNYLSGWAARLIQIDVAIVSTEITTAVTKGYYFSLRHRVYGRI